MTLLVTCCAVVAAQAPFPLEPADTSSPRGVLTSLLENGEEVYGVIARNRGQRSGVVREQARPAARRLLRCLDLSETPAYLRESVAKESTVCLIEVLGRVKLPPSSEFPGPDHPEVRDGTLRRWRVPQTDIVVYLVDSGPRQGEYLFSPDTVARAPEFYEQVSHLPYQDGALEGFYKWYLSEPGSQAVAWVVDRLPDAFRNRVGGAAIWQWAGLAIVVGLGLAAMYLAYRMGRSRQERLEGAGAWRRLTTLAFPVLAAAVPLIIRHVASRHLVLSGFPMVVVKLSSAILFLLATLVVIVSAGSRVADLLIASPKVHPRGIDAQFIRISCRVASLVLAVIVFLEGGQYLGIPLTTLLAGAGVGGLTVALAAQDTLRNLFGSLMIMLDKPFRVGERVIAKGYDGVVEEIGLRSTRLRLLTGHEATIPNDDMARSDIENVGRRPHIRRVTDLALPLNLSPEKTEQAVGILRKLLADHEGMNADYPPRVFLTDFARDAMCLRLMYWYHPADYWGFMAFGERLNLEIKREFAAAGIPFALPASETVLTAGEAGPIEVSVSEPRGAGER